MTALWWGCAFLAGAVIGWPALPGVSLLSLALVIRSMVTSSPRRTLFVGVGLILMASLGVVRSAGGEPGSFSELLDARAVRGEVQGGVTRAAGRQRFVLRGEAFLDGKGDWIEFGSSVRVSALALPEVHAGDSVRVDGRIDPVAALSGGFRSYLEQQAIAGSMYAQSLLRVGSDSGGIRIFDTARERMDGVLQGAVPGDAGALLAGLVTGDDESLSEQRRQAFRIAGLTHVTAISGSNVALLSTVLAGRRASSGRRRKGWLVVVVAAIWGYAAIVQLEPPVVRASITASLALIGVQFGRRVDYVTLTVLSAVAMVLVKPSYIGGLAFQLSFVSATALLLSVQGGEAGMLTGQIKRAVIAVTTAQVAILPLVLPLQQHVSMTSIPANLIVGPLVAVAFALGLLASVAGLIWLPAGAAMAATAGILTDLILRIVDLFGTPRAMVPLWSVSLETIMIMALLTATAVWAISDEGRRVVHRWIAERHGDSHQSTPIC